MPCFHPLSAWRLSYPVGARHAATFRPIELPKIVFNVPRGCAKLYVPQPLPCRQCVGCRGLRSREWAIRCDHEASLHDRNCFVTLTYSDQFLPFNRSLDKSVIPKFMKRLRKKFVPKCPFPKVKGMPASPERVAWLQKHQIRAYYCGEYGDRYGRPHYHILLFNFDFSDKRLHKVEKNGSRLYTSKALSKIWSDPDWKVPYGHAVIGDCTFESAAYVARYIHKKITGDPAAEHYEFVDPDTGEIFQRIPEFNEMSRNPGIAALWFDRFHSDVFPRDFVVSKGKKLPPPKYYTEKFKAIDEETYLAIKAQRIVDMRKFVDDNTPERLRVKEACEVARLKQLTRGVDHAT